MFKLLLTFLISLIPLTVNIDAQSSIKSHTEFMEEVNKRYDTYRVYQNNDNDIFSLTIVQGIYNKKPTYGLCFTNTSQTKYQIILITDGIAYSLSEKLIEGADTAIAFTIDSTLYIDIVDENNNKTEIEKLLPFTQISFEKNDDISKGENKGGSFSEVSIYAQKFDFIKITMIILAAVIVLTGSLILIFYLKRKGIFRKDKINENVINMRELLKEDTKDHIDTNEYFKKEEKDTTEEKIEEVVDIKAYLREKGYITNYASLSEEEKNRVMLELIKLKNEKRISQDRYYEETGELWKK